MNKFDKLKIVTSQSYIEITNMSKFHTIVKDSQILMRRYTRNLPSSIIIDVKPP